MKIPMTKKIIIPPKMDWVTDRLWELIHVTDFSESERALWIMTLPKMNLEQIDRFEYILEQNAKLQ